MMDLMRALDAPRRPEFHRPRCGRTVRTYLSRSDAQAYEAGWLARGIGTVGCPAAGPSRDGWMDRDAEDDAPQGEPASTMPAVMYVRNLETDRMELWT